MHKPTLPLSLLLAFIAAGCTDPATPAIPPVESTQPSTATPAKVAEEIDSIIYSDLPKDQMLERLKPFVSLMDTEDEFTKKTGLKMAYATGGGPGVIDYSLEGCGLSLVVDPDHKIRIIRRNEKSVNGEHYPQMSISAPGFEWNGYARWYPN